MRTMKKKGSFSEDFSLKIKRGSFSEALNLSAKFYLATIYMNPSFQTNIGYVSCGGHLLVKMGII